MAQATKKEKDEDFDIDAWIDAIGEEGPAPKIVLRTGKEVQISKVTASQLYLMLDLIKQIAVHLNITNFDDLSEALKNVQDPVTLMSLLGGSIDRLLDLIVALCDLNEQSVKEGLDLDDLLLIALAEWRLNEHFFTTRLIPMIQRLDTGEQSQEPVA